MSTTTPHRIRYAKLKAAGTCPRCGFRPARPGGVCCEVCIASMSPASSKELAAMAEWLASTLWDCLEYDPSSEPVMVGGDSLAFRLTPEQEERRAEEKHKSIEVNKQRDPAHIDQQGRVGQVAHRETRVITGR